MKWIYGCYVIIFLTSVQYCDANAKTSQNTKEERDDHLNLVGERSVTKEGEEAYYAGHKVFSVTPKDEAQLKILQDLKEDVNLKLDFWTEPAAVHKQVTFHVFPAIIDEVTMQLKSAGLEPKESISDLQEAINAQVKSNREAALNLSPGSIVGIYATFMEIEDWLDRMVATHPDRAAPFSAGKSYYGRSLKGIKIGKSAPGKPAIWFHAGIHAREWIAPASCIYIINLLLTSKDPEVVKLTTDLVWYIVPVLNPDGYNYTFKSIATRLWRGTRTPYSSTCIGADPNRNWDFKFIKNAPSLHPSLHPCNRDYHGPYPFSEPCVKSAAQAIMSLHHELKGFITFHSYSQFVMTPWAYTNQLPKDYDEIFAVAKEATMRVEKRHGTHWKTGAISHLIGLLIGGSSVDWVKGKAGINYAYAFELRPNDKPACLPSCPGFLLPATGIIPSGQESWEGVKFIAQSIVKKYRKFVAK